MSKIEKPKGLYYHPRYWLGWIFVWFAKLMVIVLPFSFLMGFGRFAARCVYPFLKRRKQIAMTNLRLCFPEKSDLEREILCKKSFESLGMSAVETLMAWFMPYWRFKRLSFKLVNFDEFDRAFKQKKPTIIMSGHFTCMEMVGRYVGLCYPGLSIVYQKHKSPFFQYIMASSRQRYSCGIERKDVRGIVRTLKNGGTIWYAPDQDFGNERSIFVPFFKVPCATLVAASWLVKKTDALMIFGHFRRNEDHSGYVGSLDEYHPNFASGDDYADALRYNLYLEWVIRQYPDQYLWQHRRFKSRPEGQKRFY